MSPEVNTAPRDPRASNPVVHGLTGQIQHSNAAEESAYDRHCRGYHADWQPSGQTESDLVQALADDRWRLKRASGIEIAIFALTAGDAPDPEPADPEEALFLDLGRAWLARGKDLSLLTLYESRIQRRADKTFDNLRKLQAERKAAQEKFIEEAALLQQLAESQGETYDPAADLALLNLPEGFVFSPAALDRFRRLQQARQFDASASRRLKKAA